MTIDILPSGKYRVRVWDKNLKKSVSFVHEDRNEAKKLGYAYLAGIEKTSRKYRIQKTVGECIDEYIDSKEHILSPTTVSGYRSLKRLYLSELCGIRVMQLSQDDVQKHFNALSMTKSAKTVHNAYDFLISVLNVYAPELRFRTTLPKIQKKIKHLPDAAEIIKIVEGTEIELPCILAIWLGMRMSEIRGARKSDIHNNILTIQNTIVTVDGQHIEKSQTKTTESTRQIELPQYIMNLVNALPEEQDYLTTMTGHAIYGRFKRLIEKNGLENMTFHDLRHLNASVMLMLGIPDKYAMERGGWSSTSVMKSVYQHTFSKERQIVDKKIDEYFEKIIGGKSEK